MLDLALREAASLNFNYMWLGEFDRALEADARADAIADDTVDCRRFWTRGLLHAFRGDWQAAIDACRESLERSGDPLNTAMTLASLGHAHLEQRNSVEAMPLLERSMQRLHELGYRQAEAWVAVLVSEALLGEGKGEAARERAWHALRLATERGFPYGVACARRALGRVKRAEGHAAEVKTQLEEALKIFSSIQAGFEVGRTKLALADFAHAQGDDAGATALLDAADAIFTRLAVPAWATRTRQHAQEVSSPAGQDPTRSKET